jgi:hypothetical protein
MAKHAEVVSESEWVAGIAKKMIAFVRTRATMRQRRLLMCGCCRARWPEIPDDRLQAMVELIERYANGEGGNTLVRAYKLYDVARTATIKAALDADLFACLSAVTMSNEDPVQKRVPLLKDSATQVQLTRDIFGNPFRPVAFDPSWRTSTVAALAEQMYESRDFSPMPVLADALQDAGCDNEDILAHCRGAGPHVRGCWVVDLVLGKE